MKGIVLELQSNALDKNISIEELMRKSYLVSRKLQLIDFQKWIENELNGYEGTEIPAYRYINGRYKAMNPMGGWMPVLLTPDIESIISRMPVNLPIAQIENTYEKSNGTIAISLNAEFQKIFNDCMEYPIDTIFSFCADSSELYRIMSLVRNKILEWALLLEENGIVGEELSFSNEEKEKAIKTESIINYTNNIYGDIDTVSFKQ